MNKPVAKAEKNTSPSLTIPVRTRTPQEALDMLNAGQPIDQIGRGYHDQGLVGKDFFQMDKLDKLRKISELKQMESQAKKDYEYLAAEQRRIQDDIKAKQTQTQNANS